MKIDQNSIRLATDKELEVAFANNAVVNGDHYSCNLIRAEQQRRRDAPRCICIPVQSGPEYGLERHPDCPRHSPKGGVLPSVSAVESAETMWRTIPMRISYAEFWPLASRIIQVALNSAKSEIADDFYQASGVEGTEYDVAGKSWTPADLFKAADSARHAKHGSTVPDATGFSLDDGIKSQGF